MVEGATMTTGEHAPKHAAAGGFASGHELKEQVDELRIEKTEIAREYGCSSNFVYGVLSGRFPMPRRLEATIREMIAGRRAQLRKLLDNGLHHGDTEARRTEPATTTDGLNHKERKGRERPGQRKRMNHR